MHMHMTCTCYMHMCMCMCIMHMCTSLTITGKAKVLSNVQGLAELLASLKLAEHLGAADAWCVKQGAEDVADLKGKTYAEQLAAELKLPPIKAEKLVNAIRGVK